MEYFFMFLLFFIIFICSGIGLEKVLHPDRDAFECARKFRGDLQKFVHILFGSEAQRHVFDPSLSEAFSRILADYCHDAFPPSYQTLIQDGAPFIGIGFVPKAKYTPDEINTLCRLLSLKFKQYLQAYGLNWKFFSVYHVSDDCIQIRLYYTEFSSDSQAFFRQYRVAVKQKSAPDFGVLRDEALDKELNRVRR